MDVARFVIAGGARASAPTDRKRPSASHTRSARSRSAGSNVILTVLEKDMDNQIVCPNCKRVISNTALVNAAATGKGKTSDSFVCECGDTISYWAATAQLRDQKKLGARLSKWFGGIFKSRG